MKLSTRPGQYPKPLGSPTNYSPFGRPGKYLKCKRKGVRSDPWATAISNDDPPLCHLVANDSFIAGLLWPLLFVLRRFYFTLVSLLFLRFNVIGERFTSLLASTKISNETLFFRLNHLYFIIFLQYKACPQMFWTHFYSTLILALILFHFIQISVLHTRKYLSFNFHLKYFL